MQTPDTWTIFCVSIPVSIVVWAAVADVVRRGRMKALSTRLGFQYLGATLPEGIPLGDSDPARASRVFNVLDGQFNGIRILAFDYRMGTGKRSYQRTAIAAHTDVDPFTTNFSDRSLTTTRTRGWIVLYQPKDFGWPSGLIPAAELESYLRAIT